MVTVVGCLPYAWEEAKALVKAVKRFIFDFWFEAQGSFFSDVGRHHINSLPAYLFWLFVEIIKSNYATAKFILNGRSDPEIFSVFLGLSSDRIFFGDPSLGKRTSPWYQRL